MHYIRFALISIILLAVVVTAISLFIPSSIRVSRATTIYAERQEVMNRLSDPVQWQKWYPAKSQVPLLVIDGKVKGVGNDSLQALMITTITDSSVIAENTGLHSKKGQSVWNVYAADPHSVTVQWYMDFHLRWYPWEKFAGLLLDQSYGPMLEQGLTNLKKQVEE